MSRVDRLGSEMDIWRERVRLLYAHLPFVLGGVLVAATGLAWAVWDAAHADFLIAWLGLIYGSTLIRWLIWHRYQRRAQDATLSPTYWLRLYTITAGLSGCIWGSIGLALFQTNPFVLMMLVVVYAGMTAGSVVPHSTWLPAYLAYAIPTVAPFAVRALFSGESMYEVVGALSLTFLAVNIYYGRNLQRSVVDSIQLRKANMDLIKELSEGRIKAEAAQAAAETSHQQALAANQAKNRFLATTSHDLRQPTQALLLFIDVLERESDEARRRALMDNIRDASHSLHTLLSILMDYSLIESASLKPEKEAVQLEPLLRRIVAEFSAEAGRRGLELRRVPTTLWVHSDPKLLERIVRNLVSNAVKYTRQGRVLVGCRRQADTVRIAVYDTGPGIPEALQTDIFQEFYQAHNPQRDSRQGLGLGLSIVRGLANLLGHTVGVRSRVGQGAMFHVDLPALAPTAISKPERKVILGDFAGRRIVVIDDDVAILQAMSAMLRRWGCEVVAVGSAREALRDLNGLIPDAIVADYRLAERCDGIEAITAIRRSLGQDIPAAILTGEIDPMHLNHIQQARLPFVHKPISGGKFRALLNSMIHHR